MHCSLLLMNYRFLKNFNLDEIKKSIKDCILITEDFSNTEEKDKFIKNTGSIFLKVYFIKNYAHNDYLEIYCLELCKLHNIQKIIVLSELDVLRMAKVRDQLSIEGLKFSQAVFFRDKFLMKSLAREKGIKVPEFSKITCGIDLLSFVERVGYPVIVKPICAMSSYKTIKICNQSELEATLSEGLLTDTERLPDLLAEQFINAPIYHVDGVIEDFKVSFVSVSRYLNTCLDFVGGDFLGSVTLENRPLKYRIESFVKNFFDQFPTPRSTLFHVEVFVTEKEILLCEGAVRLGGGSSIPNQIKLAYNFDYRAAFIEAQCQNKKFQGPNLKKMFCIAGRLLIPPQVNKILLQLPPKIPFEWVIEYRYNGKIGDVFSSLEKSNQDLAYFLLQANTEPEMEERISVLYQWARCCIKWGSAEL